MVAVVAAWLPPTAPLFALCVKNLPALPSDTLIPEAPKSRRMTAKTKKNEKDGKMATVGRRKQKKEVA